MGLLAETSLQRVECAALLGSQLFERPIFNDDAILEHSDAVATFDRGHAVGNHNTSSLNHDVFKRLLHFLLRVLVEGRSCLVEQQNLRLSDHSPSYGDSLLLTA